MYRDDPLEDELELRAIVGDAEVDLLLAGRVGRQAVEGALDALRLLQGWADDEAVAGWLRSPQRRLAGRTPLAALSAGDVDQVLDAAQRWAAAQG